jgi:hypothetical protein
MRYRNAFASSVDARCLYGQADGLRNGGMVRATHPHDKVACVDLLELPLLLFGGLEPDDAADEAVQLGAGEAPVACTCWRVWHSFQHRMGSA